MNIALIGMPTCGKSTIGVVAAKLLGLDFVDTDILIQNRYGAKLSKLIEENGIAGFLKMESSVIEEVDLENTVIATGGSAVYSDAAMKNLKKISKVIYLKVPFNEIEKRMTNLKERGVVIEDGKTLKDLYDERKSLYEKYADLTINEENKTLDETVHEIVKIFS